MDFLQTIAHFYKLMKIRGWTASLCPSASLWPKLHILSHISLNSWWNFSRPSEQGSVSWALWNDGVEMLVYDQNCMFCPISQSIPDGISSDLQNGAHFSKLFKMRGWSVSLQQKWHILPCNPVNSWQIFSELSDQGLFFQALQIEGLKCQSTTKTAHTCEHKDKHITPMYEYIKTHVHIYAHMSRHTKLICTLIHTQTYIHKSDQIQMYQLCHKPFGFLVNQRFPHSWSWT